MTNFDGGFKRKIASSILGGRLKQITVKLGMELQMNPNVLLNGAQCQESVDGAQLGVRVDNQVPWHTSQTGSEHSRQQVDNSSWERLERDEAADKEKRAATHFKRRRRASQCTQTTNNELTAAACAWIGTPAP